MYSATCELIWLKQFLQQLKIKGKEELITNLREVALHEASNPVFNGKNKARKHTVRQKTELGHIRRASSISTNWLLLPLSNLCNTLLF